MTARAYFFTRMRADAHGSDYERWAARVDYSFTRRQAAVGRYEIFRLGPAVLGTSEWEYVELIEVLDADAFPRVFEQPEAEPIIAELRTFIAPDPLGLVGTQVGVWGAAGAGARAEVRVVVAASLADESDRRRYEEEARAQASELVARPEVERVELVAITGRYKREEPAPVDYLLIADLPDAERASGALAPGLERLIPNDGARARGCFALVGALIDE